MAMNPKFEEVGGENFFLGGACMSLGLKHGVEQNFKGGGGHWGKPAAVWDQNFGPRRRRKKLTEYRGQAV